jgi:hypothetical protein
MLLDDKTIDGILNDLMIEAKRNREKIPHSREDGFAQALVFVGPNLEIASAPALWRDEREKYAMMRAVSETAKQVLCRAVILISDTRWIDADKVQDFLGIKPIAEIGVEAWQKEYRRILTEKFDGQIRNLPRPLWSEAILIVMKGPELKGKIPSVMARYEAGPGDTIRWIPTLANTEQHTAKFDLLPDWWN